MKWTPIAFIFFNGFLSGAFTVAPFLTGHFYLWWAIPVWIGYCYVWSKDLKSDID